MFFDETLAFPFAEFDMVRSVRCDVYACVYMFVRGYVGRHKDGILNDGCCKSFMGRCEYLTCFSRNAVA